MRPEDFSWIRRRARRVQRTFHVTRRRAVREAMRDWWSMYGKARALQGGLA